MTEYAGTRALRERGIDAMRVLVTGANGFIGRHLCTRLAAHGIQFVGVTRQKCEIPGALLSVQCDIGSDGIVEDLLKDIDTVVHLAAVTHATADAQRNETSMFRAVNVEATLRLARTAQRAGVSRFVFMSSVKVNGESTGIVEGTQQRFSERDPPRPRDAYGRSKLAAEQGLRALSQATTLDVTVLRPPLVYGPGQKGNLLRLMQAVAAGYPLPLAQINNLRSLVGVTNLADAICAALAGQRTGFETFMVADVDLSTPRLIEGMAAALGVRARLFPVPLSWLRHVGRIAGRADAVDRLTGSLLVDSSTAQDVLQWRPAMRFEDSMREAAAGVARDGRP